MASTFKSIFSKIKRCEILLLKIKTPLKHCKNNSKTKRKIKDCTSNSFWNGMFLHAFDKGRDANWANLRVIFSSVMTNIGLPKGNVLTGKQCLNSYRVWVWQLNH